MLRNFLERFRRGQPGWFRSFLVACLLPSVGAAAQDLEAAEGGGPAVATGQEAASSEEEREPGVLGSPDAPPTRDASAPETKAAAPTVEQFVGPSGLRVVLEPTPGAPSVSVCMSVQAGSALDPVDAPGAYRLLAEMLAAGGYGRGQADVAQLVESRGGRSEFYVERDVTTFCTSAPAVELPLALWVMGGRTTQFRLTEPLRREALERLADLAERTDEDVFLGRAATRLRQMAFLGDFGEAHPDLPDGTEPDVLSLGLLKDLHRQSIVAARSVVTISGGFQPDVAKRLVTEQLAPIRPGTVLGVAPTQLVRQTTERFSMAEDVSARTPAAWYGWVMPTDDARPAVDVALLALAGDARLGRKLVGKGKAAKELTLLREPTSGPRLYRLRFVGTGSRSLGTIEQSLEAEIATLSTIPMKEAELAATVEQFRIREAEQLATAPGRARALSEGVLRGRSIEQVLAPLGAEYSLGLSSEEVRLAARTWLTPERRSTIEIYPKGWQDPWQTPMPTYHIVSSGETLTGIARQHGTTVATITKMNGIAEKKAIYPGDKLKVPRSKTREVKLRTHTVKRGDTLSALALKYGVSSRGIAELNGMSVKQPIRAGQTLTIPQSDGKSGRSDSSGKSKDDAKKESQGPSGGLSHTVGPGETLGGIALRYGVRLNALALANGLTTKSMVRVGQNLVIPQDESARRPQAVTYSDYTVKGGDTLSGIAKRHGVTVTELERANGFNRKSTLRLGQHLKVPKK